MTDFTPLRIDLSDGRPASTASDPGYRAESAGGGDDDPRAWSALFAGDCIYKGRLASAPVAPAVAARVRDADVSALNFEAPLRGDGDPAAKAGPAHASHPETPVRLANAGFDAACLANNHLMDYGEDGLTATLAACADAGVATLGAGPDLDAALTPHRTRVPVGDGGGPEAVDCALVNVCEREFGVAGEDEAGVAPVSDPVTERRVAAAARDADVTVVVAHGGVEYVPVPPVGFQRRLRALVDAGADAVVAHHPHVPQGWEVYEGSPVLYSLGNFLFDSKRPNTRWGLLAELDFRGENLVRVSLLPTELHDGRVYPLGVEGGRTTDGRSVDDHLDYLRRSADLVADRETLRAHWQELALRLFDYRYAGWLRKGTGAGLSQLVTDPGAALGNRAFPPAGRRTEQLTLLNVIRNESHRDVIETALALRTGDVPDRRTPGVDRTVRDLLDWTEDEVATMYGEGRKDASGSRVVAGVRAVRRWLGTAARTRR